MPIERFKPLAKPEETLSMWARQLNYIFNNLDQTNIATTTLSLGSNQVKASNIDFGVGVDQVDAADIPITDGGSYYIGATVELALQEIGSTVRNLPSSNIRVDDTGGYYTATNVESALQETGKFLPLLTYSTVGWQVNAGFGCNGKTPQISYGLDAALSTTLGAVASSDLNRTNSLINQIRTALINNGICT